MELASKEYFRKSVDVVKTLYLDENISKIESIKGSLITSIKKNKLIMIGGNGGSACDSDHFCSELVVRYKYNRKPVKCISLNSNTSILTACANDFGYEDSFKRVVECFGNKEDILLVLSTSGNSKNILCALNYANSCGIKTIGLLGRDGGLAGNLCKQSIIIKSTETALIQQAHITILHYLAMEIELYMKDSGNI